MPTSRDPRPARLLRVGGVAIVLIGIHAVLFQVLTGAAGQRVQALEREHGASALDAARDPGAAPAAEAPGFGAWHEQEAVWRAARERDEARARRRLIGGAILVSVGVQVLLVLAIGVRALRRVPRRRA